MKRILCFILIATLCFVFISNTVAQETVLYGDVNGDDDINAKDALVVLRYAVGKERLTSRQLQAANVTKQETPNAKDALCILQKYVGKLRHFEAEKTKTIFSEPEKSVYPDGLPYDDFWKDYFANNKGPYIGGVAYVDTWEKLNQYTQTYGLMKNYYPETPHELLSVYPEEYFKDSSLILFYGFPKYSGLPDTKVTDVYRVGNELCVEVLETLSRGVYTPDNVHCNLCVVKISDKFSGVTKFNFYVKYREQQVDGKLNVKEIVEEYNKDYYFYTDNTDST